MLALSLADTSRVTRRSAGICSSSVSFRQSCRPPGLVCLACLPPAPASLGASLLIGACDALSYNFCGRRFWNLHAGLFPAECFLFSTASIAYFVPSHCMRLSGVGRVPVCPAGRDQSVASHHRRAGARHVHLRRLRAGLGHRRAPHAGARLPPPPSPPPPLFSPRQPPPSAALSTAHLSGLRPAQHRRRGCSSCSHLMRPAPPLSPCLPPLPAAPPTAPCSRA